MAKEELIEMRGRVEEILRIRAAASCCRTAMSWWPTPAAR